MVGVLMRKENRDLERQTDRHTHTERHVKTEAEIAVMQPQVKDCWQLPEPRRGEETSSLRALRERARPG